MSGEVSRSIEVRGWKLHGHSELYMWCCLGS